MPLRIGFVPGVTPDKWSRTWRERFPRLPLELFLVDEDNQRAVLDDGEADMVFVRLPVDQDGLHLIPLYEEQPVVVVEKEHPVAAYDEVTLSDLAGEQLVLGDVPGWGDIATATPLLFPEMTVKEAFEVVGSGTGIAIVPMSVARLHHRKDVVHRPVHGVPTTRVGLAWPQDTDDPRLEEFVGVVRGRRANSSRGQTGLQPAAAKSAAKKNPVGKASAKPAAGRSGSGRSAGTSGSARKRSGRSGSAAAKKAGARKRRR